MLYDKKKEVSPLDTIRKIRNILKQAEVNTKIYYPEDTFSRKKKGIESLYSCRVYIEDKRIGQNGKGTTHLYSLASAYAELIERIQNGALASLDLRYPDECKISQKLFAKKDKICVDPSFYECLANEIKFPNCNSKRLSKIIKNWQEFLLNDKNADIDCISVFDVKNNRAAYMPSFFMSTNGMSAGNTPEEAIVQGLSEIIERDVAKQIAINNYSCPIIHEDEYIKYDVIANIIDILARLGLKIEIRDASLGKGFPCICAVIYDKDLNKFSATFGAHPIFPIAIERALTEFVQGIEINIESIRKYNVWNTITSNISAESFKKRFLSISYHIIPYSHYLGFDFFTKESSWRYSSDNWVQQDLSNKEILSKMVNNILKQNYNILIKDVSFLGFPSYYIFIPQMSITMSLIARYEYDFNLKNNLRKFKGGKYLHLYEKYSKVKALKAYSRQYFLEEKIANHFVNLLSCGYSEGKIISSLELIYDSKDIESTLFKKDTDIINYDVNQSLSDKLSDLYLKNIPVQDELRSVFS